MEQAERPQETSQSGGGTRVKYGLNLTGINPSHAVFPLPFPNPATGSQAPDCPQTHGVWPLAILPRALHDSCGAQCSGRGARSSPCAGGDLKAMSSGPRGCWVPPSPLPPTPAGQAGELLSGGCRATHLPWPPQLGPLEGKGGVKEGSGRSRGWLVLETPINHPPSPPPSLVPGGAASPRPRPRGPLPPPAGRSPGQVGAPGPGRPGSGVGCSWQCGGRGCGAGGRQACY